MRVLLDSTAIPAERGGMGRYVDALIPALVAEGVDLVVACQPRDAAGLAALAPSAEVVVAPAVIARRPVRLAWEQTRLARIARAVGADVLHSPHYTMPRLASIPQVVTLPDATFFSHSQLHSRVKVRFFRSAIRFAVHHADSLIVISAATGEAIRQAVGGAPEAFHVAHLGVEDTFFHPADEAERERVRASLGLDGRSYVAFLGTLEPRKNIPALVRAWSRAVADRPDPPALVLAGGRGWDDDITPAIASVPDHLTVLRPGYLPLEDLAGFLSGAEVVAYPSLGEGFGLPVLEAMACGAAVLTTRELSLPEVGGDAVEYSGTDEASIAQVLASLLDDPGLRARLGRAAETRAAGFTWQNSARAHVQAYEAALRRTHGR